MKLPIFARQGLPLLAIFLISFLSASCGKEEPQPRANQSIDIPGDNSDNGNETNQENQNSNAGIDELCIDVDCAGDLVCVHGKCELPTEEGFGCAAPRDLGELAAGKQTVEVNAIAGQPNQQQTHCAFSDRSPEAVFSFTVPGPARVSLQASSATQTLAMEARENLCNHADARLFCTASLDEVIYAVAGTTYYVIVEATDASSLADFSLELEVEELLCGPPLAWRCEEDQRIQCYAGTEEKAFRCAGGCSDGACLGDSCASALEVTASITLAGDLNAYSRTVNLVDSPSCSTEGTTGPISQGADLFLSLPALRAGQTLRIDSKDSANRPAIGIMSSCEEVRPACLAADSTEGFLEWTAPADGDYFVLIDALNNAAHPFEYEIELGE